MLDSGKHGNISLIMKDTLYDTLVVVTPWEDPDDHSSSTTIATNATLYRRQQANETYGEALQIFENAATMDKNLKHQMFEIIEDTYITEIFNKYTGFMGVNTINGPQGEQEEILLGIG